MILPDVLGPGLRVLFCGTAASSASARVGAPYAGPGNYFWPALHEIGLTPRRLEPAEFRQALSSGIGLTDLCKTRSGSDREIGAGGFDVPALIAKVEGNEPAWIAFTSKTAARVALDRKAGYGEQPERFGGARVYVLPSPSGRARSFWDIAHWQRLADLLGNLPVPVIASAN